MNDQRPQFHTESQHELRFDAYGPTLAESLAGLDQEVRQDLAVTSIKRVIIDPSDKYELADFVTFRNGIRGLADNGHHLFPLAGFVKPVYSGGITNGTVVGVNMRVELPGWSEREALFRSPFFGPRRSHNVLEKESARRILATARDVGYLPVKFEIAQPADDFDQRLFILKKVVRMGAWVSNMHLVNLDRELAERNVS